MTMSDAQEPLSVAHEINQDTTFLLCELLKKKERTKILSSLLYFKYEA